jgi:hypothetical protein
MERAQRCGGRPLIALGCAWVVCRRRAALHRRRRDAARAARAIDPHDRGRTPVSIDLPPSMVNSYQPFGQRRPFAGGAPERGLLTQHPAEEKLCPAGAGVRHPAPRRHSPTCRGRTFNPRPRMHPRALSPKSAKTKELRCRARLRLRTDSRWHLFATAGKSFRELGGSRPCGVPRGQAPRRWRRSRHLPHRVSAAQRRPARPSGTPTKGA